MVSLLVSVTPTTSKPQPSNPQFVLAEWDYPDEYGQGIYGFRFYENSTGSWVAAPWYNDLGSFYFLHDYDDYILNWSAGVAMKLRVYSAFNDTLTGAVDEADGQNYQRHSVAVTSEGVEVFSQQNFTYYDVTSLYYEYEVVLNFLPIGGKIYTISVDYEIYYTVDTGSDTLTATSGSTDAGTPTGDYTDTHEQDLVFFGSTDPVEMSVFLWVELSEEIGV